MSRSTISLESYSGYTRQGSQTFLDVAAVANAMEQAGSQHTPTRLRRGDFGRTTIQALGNFVKNLGEHDPARPQAQAVLDHAAYLKDLAEMKQREGSRRASQFAR